MYEDVNDLKYINVKDDNKIIVDYYLNYLFDRLNEEEQIASRTGDFKKDIKKLIHYSNQNKFYCVEDVYLINQLNRIINHIEYLDGFTCEAGKLTMIVAPLGIAYDIELLYKKFEGEKTTIVYFDSLYDYIRKHLLSAASHIDVHKIEWYNLKDEEFEVVKNRANRIRKMIQLQPYSCIDDFDDCINYYGFDDCDLILAYRLKSTTYNKNTKIKELKELAKYLDKPVVLVYHPSFKNCHKLELSSLTGIDIYDVDYIYSILPGIEGYSKLKG